MPARRSDMTPTRVPDLTSVGRQLLEAGTYADAARALGRQVRLDPEDRYARYLLGVAWVGLGQRRLAREHFQRVADGGADELARLARGWVRRLAEDRPRPGLTVMPERSVDVGSRAGEPTSSDLSWGSPLRR